MKKRVFSILTAVMMVLCLISPKAFAINDSDVENATPLQIGDNTATIETGGTYATFSFTAPTTDTYVLTSYAPDDLDPKGYLYDADLNQIISNDDINGSTNRNFRLTRLLEAGKTYYYQAYLYYGKTGSFTVTFEQIHDYQLTGTTSTCLELGEDIYTCSTCGGTYTEPATALASHDYVAVSNQDFTHTLTCTVCGDVKTESCTYIASTENGVTRNTCPLCGNSYMVASESPEVVLGWYFESDAEFADWTILDVDGDGNKWERRTSNAHEGTGCIFARYNSNGADNWAISPVVNLSTLQNATLSIWAARQSLNYDDYFELYAGTSKDTSAMTKILDETMPPNIYTSYTNYTADLSAFAGQSAVYIAIRHHTTKDSFYLYVDQVEITTVHPADCDHVLELVPAAPATCTEDGHSQAYYRCTVCGRFFSDAAGQNLAQPSDFYDLPAPGHSWSEWANTTDPTCTEAGEEQRVCSVCSETETRTVAALGHNWGGWTTTTSPSCTEAGEEERVCSRCLTSETRTVAALGHKPGEYTQTVAPTCTTAGSEEAVCETCGQTVVQEIPALGHNWSEWSTTSEATCTEAGEQERTCSRCLVTETQSIPTTGHTWANPVSNNDGTHTYTCANCSATSTEDCSFETVVENGIEKSTCTVCGYVTTSESSGSMLLQGWYFESDSEIAEWIFLDLDGDGSSWSRSSEAYHEGSFSLKSSAYSTGQDNWAITSAFSLQNITNAELSVWMRETSASYPDLFELWAGTVADPDQMTKLLDSTEPSTNFEQYTVSLSDFEGEPVVYVAIRHIVSADRWYLFADQMEIFGEMEACSNHVLTLVPAGEATCTVPGHDTPYYQCENCGRTYLDAEGTQPVVVSDLATSPALGHDWSDWMETEAPTCTETGVETRICNRCNEVDTRSVSALGHDWDDPVYNDNDTHTYTCLVCGATEEEDCYYLEQTENLITKFTCEYCGHSFMQEASGVVAIAGWYFESQDEADEWTYYDEDNDGYCFEWLSNSSYSYEGSGSIYTVYGQNGAADNWAVSPAFNLSSGSNPTVSLWAARYSSNYTEEFEVYAGTTDDPSQMTLILDETTVTALYNVYENYTADLSDFAGESEVYIAIRHVAPDGYYFFLDAVEVLVGVEACQNHVPTLVQAVEATCELEGYAQDFYQCPDCGRTYLDAAGTELLFLDDITIPALGHDWSGWTYADSDQHERICDRCGVAETEACSYTSVTENGVIRTYCTVCDHVSATEEAPGGEQTVIGWYFEEEAELEGWEFLDGDGDGYNWEWLLSPDAYYSNLNVYEGQGILYSESYHKIGDGGNALTPDNWAISPEFSLVGAEDSYLSLWARGQNSSNWYDEVFAIYAIGSDNPGILTLVDGDFTTSNEYQQFTADLSLFEGQRVRIAIRHYNCEDQFILNIDNVEVKATFPDSCGQGAHTLAEVPAAEATLEADGNITYYECSVCGRYFLDEDGTEPTTPEEVRIPQLPAAFTGHSLTLNAEIGVNFVFKLGADSAADTTVTFTWMEGSTEQTATVNVADLTPDANGYYKASVYVPAKEMTEEITATISCPGQADVTNTYSVKDYAMSVIDGADADLLPLVGNDADKLEKLRELCRTMLIYGAKSQEVFHYKTGDLADEGIVAYTLTEPTGLVPASIPDTEALGFRIIGASLVLESTTSYRVYITVTDASLFGGTTCTLNGNILTATLVSGSRYYYEIEGIAAKDVLNEFTLTFTNGEATAEAIVSPQSYMRGALNGTNTALKNVVIALYDYCQAAIAYLEP